MGQFLAQPLDIEDIPVQQCIPVDDGPQSTNATFTDNVTAISTTGSSENEPVYIQYMTGELFQNILF